VGGVVVVDGGDPPPPGGPRPRAGGKELDDSPGIGP
jgi:hypothetical protein